MKRIISALLLLPFLLTAAEISIADFLPDPGFEKKHAVNAQLNAPGVKEINGWSALPAGANIWTSVSYMDKGGRTLASNRAAIEPAEGNSYLRMFTVKSNSWLKLCSPYFALKPGNIYSVSFQIAADDATPMARLHVYLQTATLAKHNELIFDLIQMEEGWNTVVYKVEYKGPEVQGRLILNAEREKNNVDGSLNFDNFRKPTADDLEYTLQPSSPDRKK